MWKHPSPHSGLSILVLSYGYDVSLVLFTFWAAIPVHLLWGLPSRPPLDIKCSLLNALFTLFGLWCSCGLPCPVPYRFWYPVLSRTPFSSCMASDCLTTVLLSAVPNGFWTKCSGRKERTGKRKEKKKAFALLWMLSFWPLPKAHSKVASSFETFRHLN